MRLLAEAACEQVIGVLADVAAAAVADPDERGKLAYLLARPRVRATGSPGHRLSASNGAPRGRSRQAPQTTRSPMCCWQSPP